ncbi:unnamed protein product [Adineta steineri]|uniref:Uncharacterized protein n=1 Tax=Adineta steineri TaxID=433720 RepID=A0A814CL22_9BILA|nr:unnamed protein product [Adineta steineri]CAF3662235.1 unnamed protein product [Adineta steineri]
MASLRLKVQLGDEKRIYARGKPLFRKFIYSIDSSSNETIGELIRKLQDYINKHFSHFNIRLVQLMTHDGFILSKSDLYSSVLKDNDHIICIDMRRFIDEYFICFEDSTLWLERKQYDATNNKEKFIRIGLNNVSELFIRLFGTVNVSGLYIFGIYELIKIANEKSADKLITRLDGTMDSDQSTSADWFLECKWEYDTTSNTNLFIVCSFKIASSDEIWSSRLQLILDDSHMRIEKGEITHLAGDTNDGKTLTDKQKERLKELAAQIPPPKRTGPEIKIIPQNLKITKHECEGESSVRMAYGNTTSVTTNQESSAISGTLLQQVYITPVIFSKKSTILPEILNQKRSQPVDKPISITNLALFYQMHDGGWHECQDVAIAPLSEFNEDPKWLSHLIINIQPDKLVSFIIKGNILVKGECGRSYATRERMHRSLPQPLKLKIVVTDSFNKQCSLIVEQLNQPLELPTIESFKQNAIGYQDLFNFVYADDCDSDERLYIWMGLGKNKTLTIRNSNFNSSSLERKTLLAMEFNAKKNKITESELPSVSEKNDPDEIKATILYDPLTYISYAIRFEISTKTSKAEETVLIPIEKMLSE